MTPPTPAQAAAQSAEVQPLWALLRRADRARYVRRAAQAVIDELDDLARALARADGRSEAEVGALELLPAVDGLAWLAQDGVRALRTRRQGAPRGSRPLTRARIAWEPRGVAGLVGAPDAPFAEPLVQVATALLAGNGVVLLPAPPAQAAARRIARIWARAGLPERLLQVVDEPAGRVEAGRALLDADAVSIVAFTGEAGDGREVARAGGEAGKPVLLETGAPGGMLVLADARVDRAAAGALTAAFAGQGRTRGAVQRAWVDGSLCELFVAQVVTGARGRSPVDVDPRAGQLVEEAAAQGAVLRCGGPAPDGRFAPAVLSGVTDAMAVARERVAAPLLAVTEVASPSEAIASANARPPAVGTSVWTDDRFQGARIARELRRGATWINDHPVSPMLPALPWGGGVGGEEAVRAFARPRPFTWDPPTRRAPWWEPYDSTLDRAARAVARLGSVRDADRHRALRDAPAVARAAARALRGR